MNASQIQADPAAAFDIAQFEASDTAVMDVLLPNGQPMMHNGQPVQIELYGPGSEQDFKAQVEIDRVNSERMMQTLRGKTAKDEVAERRAAQIKKLAAVTKEVRNLPVSAVDIYGNQKLGYITNQVLKFQGDWANFLPPSAQT